MNDKLNEAVKFFGVEHFSHSSLSSFDCPWRGYREVFLKEVSKRSTIPLLLGSSFHKMMEVMFFTRCWNRRLITSYWPRVFKDELRSVNEWEGEKPNDVTLSRCHDDGLKMVRTMFERFGDYLRDPFQDERGVFVEQEFLVPLDEFNIKGFIDLVLPDKDGSVIVTDWKTGRTLPKKKHEGVSTYEDQLQLYAYVMRCWGIKCNKMTLVFPRVPDVVVFQPSAEGEQRQLRRLNNIRERSLRLFNVIKSGETREKHAPLFFEKIPNDDNCFFCPFKKECSDYVQQERRESKMAADFQQRLLQKIK